MAWTVEFTSSAARSFRKLPADLRSRLGSALRRYAETGAGDVRHLVGRDGQWRLRVGDHRIIFERHLDRLVILVLVVGNRRDVYRD